MAGARQSLEQDVERRGLLRPGLAPRADQILAPLRNPETGGRRFPVETFGQNQIEGDGRRRTRGKFVTGEHDENLIATMMQSRIRHQIGASNRPEINSSAYANRIKPEKTSAFGRNGRPAAGPMAQQTYGECAIFATFRARAAWRCAALPARTNAMRS